MNALTLAKGSQQLRAKWDEWRQHPMLKDPISLAALVGAVALSVITLVILLLKVHIVDYRVGVHYMNLVGFDKLGSWYEVYRFAAFSAAVTVINGSLAAKSFHRNRLVSFFLLIGAVIVNLLCLVISSAFAVIV